MSRIGSEVIEAIRESVIPAKASGFDEVSVKIDLSGFDDPTHTLIVEIWSGSQRIAYMEAQGGPRPATDITGKKIVDPDLLVFATGSNRDHKNEIKVFTKVKGDVRQKTPLEVLTK